MACVGQHELAAKAHSAAEHKGKGEDDAGQGSPHQIRPDRDSVKTMSTRYNNGSHYENHQRAAELHDAAAHAHRVGEHQGKQDHLTGHEHSRQALVDSQEAHEQTQTATAHGIAAF